MEQSRLNERLIKASEDGDINKVKQLIEEGADVNHAENKDGNTPLIWASRYGYFNIVKELIEHGANVNQGADDKNSPLMFAIVKGNLEIVKYLISKGANVNQRNNFRSTPLSLANIIGHLEIVKYLSEHDADWSPIKNKPIFTEIIKEEMNKLKSELTENYLSIERGTPQTITGTGKIKSSIPKNLLLKTVYEKNYQEYCGSSIDGKLPPIRLIALANILKLDYSLDISWSDLCNRVKNVLYRLL